MYKKRSKTTYPTPEVETRNLFASSDSDVNDGLINLSKSIPTISVEDPTKKTPLNMDVVSNAGCPIFYGYNGSLSIIATPYDQVMMDIKRNNDLYEKCTGRMFSQASDFSGYAKGNTVRGLRTAIDHNTIDQFTSSMLNLIISYLVDNFRPELSIEDNYYGDPMLSFTYEKEIAIGCSNYKYDINTHLQTLKFVYEDTKDAMKHGEISIENANGVLMMNICTVRNNIMTTVSNILSDIIRSICFGTKIDRSNPNELNHVYTRDRIINPDPKVSTTHNDIADFYMHLNAVGISIVANLTQTIELMLFQFIGTLNYLYNDEIEKRSGDEYIPFR